VKSKNETHVKKVRIKNIQDRYFTTSFQRQKQSSLCIELKGVIVKEASLSKTTCTSLCFSSTLVCSMHSFRSREKNM